jgi:transcriptional regulator with XRE-family HTH domain
MTNNLNEQLGSRLREARRLSGMTQKEMAKKINSEPLYLEMAQKTVTQKMVSRVETGQCPASFLYVQVIALLTGQHTNFFTIFLHSALNKTSGRQVRNQHK